VPWVNQQKMASLPLPLAVWNPVYPVTPVLHLTGVQLGWTVSVTGSVSGSLADVTYTHPDTPSSNQWIPLHFLPKEGEFIIVEQYSDAGHSVSSGPSPDKVVQVRALPTRDLPALIVEAPPNTCSNAIGLDGIIPGAWINVEIDGGPLLLRQQARRGTSDVFVLPGSDPLPDGKSLNVWQEIGSPNDKNHVQTSPKVNTGTI
jgi:hypothetical protein